MIHYDLEGHRRIVAERIERIADDYRRANTRHVAHPPERPAAVLSARRSAQWPQYES